MALRSRDVNILHKGNNEKSKNHTVDAVNSKEKPAILYNPQRKNLQTTPAVEQVNNTNNNNKNKVKSSQEQPLTLTPVDTSSGVWDRKCMIKYIFNFYRKYYYDILNQEYKLHDKEFFEIEDHLLGRELWNAAKKRERRLRKSAKRNVFITLTHSVLFEYLRKLISKVVLQTLHPVFSDNIHKKPASSSDNKTSSTATSIQGKPGPNVPADNVAQVTGVVSSEKKSVPSNTTTYSTTKVAVKSVETSQLDPHHQMFLTCVAPSKTTDHHYPRPSSGLCCRFCMNDSRGAMHFSMESDFECTILQRVASLSRHLIKCDGTPIETRLKFIRLRNEFFKKPSSVKREYSSLLYMKLCQLCNESNLNPADVIIVSPRSQRLDLKEASTRIRDAQGTCRIAEANTTVDSVTPMPIIPAQNLKDVKLRLAALKEQMANRAIEAPLPPKKLFTNRNEFAMNGDTMLVKQVQLADVLKYKRRGSSGLSSMPTKISTLSPMPKKKINLLPSPSPSKTRIMSGKTACSIIDLTEFSP